MGVLDSFYRKYHDRGVELIAISTDKPRIRDQVEAMMKPLAFPAALMSDTSGNGFGSPDAIPVTYIIDGKGIIRNRLTPDQQELTEKILAGSVEPLLNQAKSGK
jgi:peroxiredoxin